MTKPTSTPPPPADAAPTVPVRLGGPRAGAGRPAGQGTFGEATVPMRVPVGLKPTVVAALADYRQRRDARHLDAATQRLARAHPVPAERFASDPPPANLREFTVRVPAGFPSPADDHQDDGIDLNRLLVRNGPATFFYRVSGDSMNRAGILDNDRVIVDRSLEARPGDIVIAVISGEGHTVKRFRRRADGCPMLVPESDNPVHRPRVFGRARRAGPGAEHEQCFDGDAETTTTADDTEMCIWGVVTGCVRQWRNR